MSLDTVGGVRISHSMDKADIEQILLSVTVIMRQVHFWSEVQSNKIHTFASAQVGQTSPMTMTAILRLRCL